MKKTKILKGKVVHKYRNRIYTDAPEKTFVKKMLYDDTTNTTYIIYTKHLYIIEILCVAALLFLCYLKYNNVSTECNFHYSSSAMYCDGELFINIYVEDDGNKDLRFELFDNDNVLLDNVLHTNEYVISIPIEDIKESYTLKVSYKSLSGIESKEYKIFVRKGN